MAPSARFWNRIAAGYAKRPVGDEAAYWKKLEVTQKLLHPEMSLLEDRAAAIAKVHRLLKPGGLFVSSTACLGDSMKFFKLVGPIGHFFGLVPLVRVFTGEELLESLTAGGFSILHHWQPGKGKALFVVARKLDAKP